ncbi:MAG: glycosyltransferase [Bacteroidota bacterium]
MLISVITPSFNRLPYLKEAIASVQSSITAPLDIQIEHIIHDTGSTDGTLEWLQEGNLPQNVKWIRSNEKLPPGKARHAAIELSAGEYIMPLDDDDILLQRTVHNFAWHINQPNQRPVSWLVSDFLRVDEKLTYMKNEDYYGWFFQSTEEMLRAIFSAQHFIQGNVCFSRELYNQAGGYDQTMTMAEDLDLYVRFVLENELPHYAPFISHLHRMHSHNISIGVDKDKHQHDLTDIYQKNAPRLEKRGIRMEQLT